jgi:DNA-binding transcriptional regulator GbsR (MarR family)
MRSPPSKTRKEMIDLGGRLCRGLGVRRMVGQIYGLLFLATEPLSLDEMVTLLGISRTSVSRGTRQLRAWGAIRQASVLGDRRDYYVLVEDIGAVVRGTYKEFLKPRVQDSWRHLDALMASLEKEQAEGVITREEFKTCGERLRILCRLQKRLQAAAPLVERLLWRPGLTVGARLGKSSPRTS